MPPRRPRAAVLVVVTSVAWAALGVVLLIAFDVGPRRTGSMQWDDDNAAERRAAFAAALARLEGRNATHSAPLRAAPLLLPTDAVGDRAWWSDALGTAHTRAAPPRARAGGATGAGAGRAVDAALAEQFRQYRVLHARMTDAGVAEDRLNEKRFLVVRASSGCALGRRLLGVVSGFMLAMLTDRALLVDWPGPGTFSDYFTPPFDVEYAPVADRHGGGATFEANAPRIGDDNPASMLLCNDHAHSNAPVVVLASTRYLCRHFGANPHHRERAAALFGPVAGAAYYAALDRLLLVPHAAVLRRVRVLAAERGINGRAYIVGIEFLRRLYAPSDVGDAARAKAH